MVLPACVTSVKRSSLPDDGFSSDDLYYASGKDHKVERKKLSQRYKELKKEMFKRSQTKDLPCSKQISEEVSWLLANTSDMPRIERRLKDWEQSIRNGKDQSFANEQSPDDGAWGACYTEWWWRVVESTQQLRAYKEKKIAPKYPLRFIDKINSPDILLSYLRKNLTSDIKQDGINRRRELNEMIYLLRLITDSNAKFYKFHPRLRSTLVTFIKDEWQNPDTGFWGAWYVTDQGVLKTNDLSITFHIVSYLEGNVDRWNQMMNTLILMRDRPYPLGWRHADGTMSNHHNYDVVKLMRLGWQHFSSENQEITRAEIRKMLDWCLNSTINPDGSFVENRSDDSLADSYYFGVSFLTQIGFFDEKYRFWTNEDFSKAAQPLKEKILKKMKSIPSDDVMMKDAIKVLEGRD